MTQPFPPLVVNRRIQISEPMHDSTIVHPLHGTLAHDEHAQHHDRTHHGVLDDEAFDSLAYLRLGICAAEAREDGLTLRYCLFQSHGNVMSAPWVLSYAGSSGLWMARTLCTGCEGYAN